MIGLSQPKNQKALATGNDRLIVKYVLSSASAFVAEFGESTTSTLVNTWVNIVPFLVTYPLDLAKTRLQIQGEKGTAANGNGKAGPLGGTTTQAYRGLFRTALGIGKCRVTMQSAKLEKIWAVDGQKKDDDWPGGSSGGTRSPLAEKLTMVCFVINVSRINEEKYLCRRFQSCGAFIWLDCELGKVPS